MPPIRLLIVAALASAWTALPAAAEGKRYALDWALDYCMKRERGHTALAVSDFGNSWCAWEYPSAAEAEREAVRGCKADLPGGLAKAANCAVIYAGGQITDEARAALMRKDVRLPVRIESFNGDSGQTEVMKGFITLGGAPDEITRTAEITLADGTPVCTGAARLQKVLTKFRFTATCFGDQVFKGEAKVTGVVRAGGLNRMKFDLLIKNPPHWARIVTE